MKWKQCINYPKLEISNTGLLRDFNTKEILEPSIDDYGYLYFKIKSKHNIKNKWHKPKIHRLVATAFVKGNNLLTVNHIDGNKLNNCYKNLEWVDRKTQSQHAFKYRLAKNRRDIEVYDIISKEYFTFTSLKEAAKALDITRDRLLSNIRLSQTYPIYNRYKIKILGDMNSLTPNSKTKSKSYWVYDKENKKWFKCSSIDSVSYFTGIIRSYLTLKLKRNTFYVNENYLITKNKLNDPKNYFYNISKMANFIKRVPCKWYTYELIINEYKVFFKQEAMLYECLLNFKLINNYRDMMLYIFNKRLGEKNNTNYEIIIKEDIV